MPVHSPLPALDIAQQDIATYFFERAHAAVHDASAPLVVDAASGRSTTLAEIQAHASALAQALRAHRALLQPSHIPGHPGLATGPVVATLMPADICLTSVHFATLLVGGATALLDPALAPGALGERLRATCTRAVFVTAELLPTLCAALELADYHVPRELIVTVDRRCPGHPVLDDLLRDNAGAAYCPPPGMSLEQLDSTVALIVYSSGTTGSAKGVMLTHRNIIAAQLMVSGYVTNDSKKPQQPQNQSASPATILSALPPHHLYGFSVQAYQPLASGCRLVVLRDTSAAAYLQAIDAYGVARLCATPWTLQLLFENSTRSPDTSLVTADTPQGGPQDFDVSSVRAIVCGGASIPPAKAKKYAGYFGGRAMLVVGYGSTEAASVIAGCTFVRPPGGAVGVLYPGTSAKVLDTEGCETEGFGTLYVKGPQVMPGYLAVARDAMPPVDSDGYLCVGDYARVTPDGAVYLRGRTADVIYTEQGPLPAVEVEEMVEEHVAVRDCAVVGRGPRNAAWPVIHVVIDGAAGVSVDDIDAWVRSRVAYKFELNTAERIPKNHGGKILRSFSTDNDNDDAPLVFEPSKRVLQLSQQGGLQMVIRTLVASLFTALVLLLPLLLLAALIYLPASRIPLAAYIAFCYLDPAIDNGIGRRLQWVRSLSIWQYVNAYFPVRIVLEEKLDPSRSYIFGVSPHGILCFSGQVVIGSMESGLDRALPGITLHPAALHHALTLPLFGAYLLAIGSISSSRRSIRQCLARGKGHSVGIVIGGAKESLHTNRGSRKLVMKNRRGFVREAIMAGAPLVPSFIFGENDIFRQVDHPLLRKLQTWMQSKMMFALPVFYGRFGLIPRKTPLTAVFGRPIYVEKNLNPSYDEINRVHVEYIARLQKLYARFKPVYDPEGDDTLVIA
ncbi:2-acylglycerol O-acyltransferase 1 [Coemansia erecta]|uniref:diacylglycerol O-acyltransferase n=1 Tax=Coemansia erecta TaxID=147472 RepID=A0A9W7Y5G6_9FUNG|nr:2-acylglycerol O-acyltransferase 1 [Coemansia erecta]